MKTLVNPLTGEAITFNFFGAVKTLHQKINKPRGIAGAVGVIAGSVVRVGNAGAANVGRGAEAMRRHLAAVTRRGWTELFAAAAQVRAYALATALQRSPAECEALRESATAAMAGLDRAPKGARSLLDQQ